MAYEIDPSDLLAKSQIRRAGDRLRRQLRDRSILEVLTDESNQDAWQIVDAFRREHVIPTAVVTSTSQAASLDLQSTPVVPRIKRAERIVEKIARSATALDRLQDVGGCRIVVPNLAKQHTLLERLTNLDLELVKVNDYVSPAGTSRFDAACDGPKGSGYRAFHLVHRVGHRLIETQVRTETQQNWAVAAERAEQMTGFAIKFGDAPGKLLDYFRVASQIQALQEHGEPVDSYLVRDLAELWEHIRRYYRSNR